MYDVVNDHDGDDGKRAHPQEVGVSRNGETGSAAYFVDIQNDDTNDFGEAQGNDGEVVTAQAQRGNADDQSCQGCDDRADQNSQQENQRMGQAAANGSTKR